MDEPIPPALVLGCNTPHGIGVLSDWIEERTGYAPDFADAGWSNVYRGDSSGDGSCFNEGYGTGDGNGSGDGYCNGDGDGYGDGFYHGYGNGYRSESDDSGDGNGHGYGDDRVTGNGTGNGYNDGNRTAPNDNPSIWQRIGHRLRRLIR